eukprot:scaffold21_cov368-Prasinococcus_capsulatus_cf.AAC.15
MAVLAWRRAPLVIKDNRNSTAAISTRGHQPQSSSATRSPSQAPRHLRTRKSTPSTLGFNRSTMSLSKTLIAATTASLVVRAQADGFFNDLGTLLVGLEASGSSALSIWKEWPRSSCVGVATPHHGLACGHPGTDRLGIAEGPSPPAPVTIPEEYLEQCPDGCNIIMGTLGDDMLIGAPGCDCIFGLEGDDYIDGRGGTDYLFGMEGDDTIYGGAGADILSGGFGDDVLYGQKGTDQLFGYGESEMGISETNDLCGYDMLLGGTDVDVLYPGFGNDILYSISEDTVNAMTANAVTLVWADGALTPLDDSLCGDLDVTLVTTPIMTAFDEATCVVGFTDAGIYVMSEGWLFGTCATDTLMGGDSSDYVYGLPGTDYLYGGAGDDWMFGGLGSDYMFGSAGTDYMYGGAGGDSMWGETNGDYIFGEKGADWISGGAGIDEIYGGDGADSLFGDGGKDTLYGGNDDDELTGGTQKDAFYGGDGCDVYTDLDESLGEFGEEPACPMP